MPPEREEPEPYNGRFVILRSEGYSFTVAIEPPLPTGEGQPRTFGSKHEAWGAARDLWSLNRLPFCDETEGHFGHRNAAKYSDE